MSASEYVKWFGDLTSKDVSSVGGKNASLGEMMKNLGNKGIPVPSGFATTAHAYRTFVKENDLADKIKALIDQLSKGDKPQ